MHLCLKFKKSTCPNKLVNLEKKSQKIDLIETVNMQSASMESPQILHKINCLLLIMLFVILVHFFVGIVE